VKGRLEQREVSREGLGVAEKGQACQYQGTCTCEEWGFLVELVSGSEIVCFKSEGMILPGLDAKSVR
jgi:hypothetical protein